VSNNLVPPEPETHLRYLVTHLRRAHVLNGSQFDDVATIPLRNLIMPALSLQVASRIQRYLSTPDH